jgi:hypothetical protein
MCPGGVVIEPSKAHGGPFRPLDDVAGWTWPPERTALSEATDRLCPVADLFVLRSPISWYHLGHTCEGMVPPYD